MNSLSFREIFSIGIDYFDIPSNYLKLMQTKKTIKTYTNGNEVIQICKIQVNQILHAENIPSYTRCVFINGLLSLRREEYYTHGKLHRVNGPAEIRQERHYFKMRTFYQRNWIHGVSNNGENISVYISNRRMRLIETWHGECREYGDKKKIISKLKCNDMKDKFEHYYKNYQCIRTVEYFYSFFPPFNKFNVFNNGRIIIAA